MLEREQMPRCCRRALEADEQAGLDSQALRGLDPSGRYVPCANCAIGFGAANPASGLILSDRPGGTP